VLAGSTELARRTRAEAHRLLTNPVETRKQPRQLPTDFGMAYHDVRVRTSDGLSLVGWYVPSTNGAAVLLQHGYKSERSEMLNEAAMLHRHGYGVLITSLRTHDMSEGSVITFGKDEMKDLDAWFAYLEARPDVDPERLGAIGNSLGGTLVIEFAATQPRIKAVATNSAFSSLEDTIETSVRFFTNLPPFPFAPMITFWAEREAGIHVADVDAKRWIRSLSPRPVLLMQGGQDIVISRESGQRLFDAAGEPKSLWFDPDVGHAKLDVVRPQEYERRVAGLFDEYLVRR
jgi:fermentation-respiration switch protein FrsA (DUF1100 family)